MLAAVLGRTPTGRGCRRRRRRRFAGCSSAASRSDPKRRLRDIGDARIEIDEALKSPRSDERVPTRGPAHGRGAMAAAVIATAVVAALLGAVAARRLATPPQPPVIRFSISAPPGKVFRGLGRALDISRDGTQVVYTTNRRSLSAFDVHPGNATDSEGFQTGIHPTFSPDGLTVAMWWPREQAIKGFSSNKIGTVMLASASRDVGGLFAGMSWGPDGIVVGHGRRGIVLYPTDGSPPKQVARVAEGEGAVAPEILPDREHLLFTVTTGDGISQSNQGKVVLQSLRTDARRTVIERGSSARYVPSGHIVYALEGTLFALPFDLRRLAATGPAVRVLEGVRHAAIPDAQFSISDSGTLVFVPGPASGATSYLDLALIDRKGTISPLNLPSGAYEAARVSPDGRRVAFGSDDGKEAIVWVHDLSGSSAPRRLTFGGRNKFPVWSPDGDRIVFQSDREGEPVSSGSS